MATRLGCIDIAVFFGEAAGAEHHPKRLGPGLYFARDQPAVEQNLID
jgi:hypothetical protein